MSMFSLSSLIASAKSSGLTGTSLVSFIQSVSFNSPATQAKGILTTMLANINDGALIASKCTDLQSVANLSSGVDELVTELRAAATPDARVAIIQEMETILNA